MVFDLIGDGLDFLSNSGGDFIDDLGDVLIDSGDSASGGFDFLGALSDGSKLAGQVSDLFTSSDDRKAAETPQFATRPIEQQVSDLDAIREWVLSNTSANQIPTRRLSQAEANDPIFAPQAINYLQQHYDSLNAPQSFNSGLQNAVTANGATGAPVAAPVTPQGALDGATPRNLAGWDEENQVYQGNGVVIHGEAGRAAAERQSIISDFERQLADQGRLSKGYGWVAPAIAETEDGRVNPFTGQTFDRTAALDALAAGDLSTVTRQANTAIYDPTPSFLDKYGKPIALSLFTAGAGSALGAAIGAAGVSGTAATALQQAGKYALGQGLQATQG